MSCPDISVIILTYNQEETVSRAIESVLAQDPGAFSFEIVIGDDASTDSTRIICERFAAQYPHIIRLMPYSSNKGVVRNYFDTLDECRGRYIADCAGDDYWLDNTRLQRQAALLDSAPEVVLVHGAWREVTADGATVRHCNANGMAGEEVIIEGRDLLAPLLEHKSPLALHLSTAMFRAAVARNVLTADRRIVDNPEFRCEDLPLIAALLASGQVAYDPTEMLAYTVGESTVSNPDKLTTAFDYYTATMRCTDTLARHYGIATEALEQYFKSRAIHIAKLALHIDTPEARRTVAETMRSIHRPLPLLAQLILIYARILG